jgi:2-polyprenyl-3-methyl-5-hydroxy-6-metoxy-1,4-benzoquinol methylase
MDDRGRIEEHFDERAATYHNPVTDFMGERELRVIRRFVPEGSKVLDYGCGTGRTTMDHLRRGCDVTAYDLSREMLAVAERRAAKAGYAAELTADESTLVGRTWPIVTCIGVLDYYPDPLPLLRTLSGYLAPGGLLVATYPNALSPLGWTYAIVSRLFTYPATPRTPRAARRAAAEAGLRVTALRHAAPQLPPLGHTLVLAMGHAE